MYSFDELKVEYTQVATTDNETSNQGNLVSQEYFYNEENKEHYTTLIYVGELHEFSPQNRGYGEKKWLGFRVNFDNDNNAYNYSIYSTGLEYYTEYDINGKYIDIYFDAESYNIKTYDNKFIIIDKQYNKQEYINITYLRYDDSLSMNYNAGYDVSYSGYHYDTGCIDFPEERWKETYEKRILENRYFAYIKDNDINEYVCYVNYRYNKNDKRYEYGIVIEFKYSEK
jgi:hypothetical protein